MTSKSSKVFKQFGYMKNYCSQDKLSHWNANKVAAEARWVEMFKHLHDKSIPFREFSSIIEYVLCFPGTSAPVERLLAMLIKYGQKRNHDLK